jgi:hypothetical protein
MSQQSFRPGVHALLAVLVVLPACSGEAADSVGDEVSAVQQQAGAQTDPQLPTGHPPMSSPSSPGMSSPIDPPPGSGTGASALEWTDPEGWQAVTPSSNMRRAQYLVPGDGGDAECVIFYFGPGQGGDPEANVLRWADQFGQADGRPSRDVLQTEEVRIGDISVLLAEVTGIYSGGMAGIGGPRELLPGFMLLGAVAQGPDANWFFKFTGPESTVRANREQFLGLIESLRQGAGEV